MKLGKGDIQVTLHFTEDELDFLQANTFQMAEAFDLDDRIAALDYDEPVQFHAWDLECLSDVTEMTRADADEDEYEMIDALLQKLSDAMAVTDAGRKK
jgi:hypothetical protein